MDKSRIGLAWLPFLVALVITVSSSPSLRLSAGILPPLDLKHLVGKSDIIAVGRVAGIREGASALARTASGEFPARGMTATLQVDAVLKGQSPGRSVEFGYVRPEEMIGYWPIGAGEYGVFFLEGSTSGLKLVDPYHPYVAAVPGATVIGRTAFERVVAELAAALESPTASRDGDVMARSALEQTPGPEATEALLRGARSSREDLRYHCVAALLRRNDINYLKDAAEILVHPPSRPEPDWVEDIAFGLLGVRDPRAIPALSEILAKSPLVNARRSAAGDLRSMQDPKAIKPLALGLFDTDIEVQYFAVIGLAVKTGAVTEWSPAEGTFRSDPHKYITHWRDWARAQGYAPSKQKP